MSDDVGLQRAILASFQSPSRPPSQPRASPLKPSVGRVDRLMREGIAPQPKKSQPQRESSKSDFTSTTSIDERPILTSRSERTYNRTPTREVRKTENRSNIRQTAPFSHHIHSLAEPLPSPSLSLSFSSPSPSHYISSSSSSSSSNFYSSPSPSPSPSPRGLSHSNYSSSSSNYRTPPSRSISQPSFSPRDSSDYYSFNLLSPHHTPPSPSHHSLYPPPSSPSSSSSSSSSSRKSVPPPVSFSHPINNSSSHSSSHPISNNFPPPAPLPPNASEEWDTVGPGSFVKKSNSEFQIESPNKLLSISSLWSQHSMDVMHSKNFSIFMQVKVFPSTSGKLAENLVFFLFLLTGNNNPNDPISPSEPYTCVSVNMYKKLVQVEQLIITRQTKTPTVLDQILLPSIKTSSFFDVKLTVMDNCKLDVFIDNSCILSSVFIQHSDIKYPRFGCGLRGKGVATIRNLSFVNSQNSTIDSTPKQSLPPYTGDDKDLVNLIERDVLSYNLGVTWESIAGLTDAKRLLNEAVILPALLPDYFTGIREPWKGVLLFGPPGTGKTMLAKAVASQSNTTFFNVSTATLLSKWHGESSRLVRVLFNMARYYAPSTVFLDEIDALVGTRGASNEHEATRQLKSELLQQIDGICTLGKDGEKKRVTFLAASNFPWLIDDALRRRLEKRIYIPLPELEGRLELLKLQLKSVKLYEDVELPFLAQKMAGYSAADITMVCRDASMMAMRAVINGLDPDQIKSLRREDIDAPVRTDDFLNALQKIKSSVSPGEVQKYKDWMNEFGSS